MPYDFFPQRTSLHKIDPFHENKENRLSLRTNSKQPRENDVNCKGNHFYPLNSTSREVSVIKIHAWQGSSMVLLFEFHDKTHFMKFYFKFKVPFPKGFPNEDRECNAFQRGNNQVYLIVISVQFCAACIPSFSCT